MRNISIKKVFIFSIISIVFLIVGIFIGVNFGGNKTGGNMRETRLAKDYKFINPLLECNDDIAKPLRANKLESSIDDYMNQQESNNKITKLSIYFRDLNNGPWIGVDEYALFSPASLMKVPMMIALFKMAEDDPTILDKKIINNIGSNYDGENFIPQIKIESGKEYSVSDLIERMIIYSDNIAYNLLFKTLDARRLELVYEDLGVDLSKAKIDPEGNVISIKDYSTFFRILYNSSYLDRKMSEKALELLSRTSFADGLVAGVPKEVVVSHKFGERNFLETGEKQLHDCGIIYEKRKPYLLCVMTRGNNFDNLAETIRGVSSIVYSFVSQ